MFPNSLHLHQHLLSFDLFLLILSACMESQKGLNSFIFYYDYVSACVYAMRVHDQEACVTIHIWRLEDRFFWNWFSFTFRWVLGMELRSAVLYKKCLYPMNHQVSPQHSFKLHFPDKWGHRKFFLVCISHFYFAFKCFFIGIEFICVDMCECLVPWDIEGRGDYRCPI